MMKINIIHADDGIEGYYKVSVDCLDGEYLNYSLSNCLLEVLTDLGYDITHTDVEECQ